MGIKVKDKTGQYASFESLYQVNADGQAGVVQKQIVVPNPVVPWSITELVMENVKITHALSQIDQNIVLQTTQDSQTVDLFVQLSGQSQIRRSNQSDRRYRSGQCNLVYTPSYEGELNLGGPAVSTFALQFSAAFFRPLLDEKVSSLACLAEAMDKGKMHALTPHNPLVTPKMKAILYDLLHCPFKGFSRRLFLEAKVLELLAWQMEQIGANRSEPTGVFRPDEVDKLVAVKEWLDDHFLQPITLLDVCRLVGLNDFKLKKGFRVLFNTTVFGYLTELRMSHARHLLLESGQTVTEVADALGYRHGHHFTHAFRKHFGYLPGKLRA